MVNRNWIVFGVDGAKITLISKTERDANIDQNGILHQGSYLTIDDGEKKFILRVDETLQNNPYSPSPMIVDMDLSSLNQDKKCQNIIHASRVAEVPDREDGMSSFIKPQMLARRANQKEINFALGVKNGIPVFPATVFSRSVQHLYDDEGVYITAKIPEDVFFYQMLITGSTGSGKTVAMKYLAQYFIENLQGAVLAINVKEEDFLTMDKPSISRNPQVLKEWKDLGYQSHGLDTFSVYYPGHRIPRYSKEVTLRNCEKITLKTEHIDPETLTGLIQNISDLGADQLPSIFRYWQGKVMKQGKGSKLSDFINYFNDPNKGRQFMGWNSRNEEMPINMHPGTFNNVLNALTRATEYFDVEDAVELNSDQILQGGKMSVIDVTAKNGFGFGAVLLRDLLEKIYDAKSEKQSDVPVLIIIDEVHEFYGSARSREALQVLDSICRKGRSLKIGVIFASQNVADMPGGITNVVNSKIYFKADTSSVRSLGIDFSGFEIDAFKSGYAIARIHELNQLKFVKFPLSLAGVNDQKGGEVIGEN
jgi:uncharacterized protein